MNKETRPGQAIKMKTPEELFGVDNEMVMELEINKLQPFPNHPFKVENDNKMKCLVENIQNNGVLNPIIVRHIDQDRYEIISGHRRVFAMKQLEKEKIPAIIRDMTNDEAAIQMVDSNIQREKVLPSELAFAFKMRVSAAENIAGRPSKEGPRKKNGKDAVKKAVAAMFCMSSRQVERYINLTQLIPELMELVDKGSLKFITAVDVSSLDPKIQKWVLEYKEAGNKVKGSAIKELKKKVDNGEMSQSDVTAILDGDHPKSTVPSEVTFSMKDLQKYFKDVYTPDEMKSKIKNILAEWMANQVDKESPSV